MLNNFSCIDVKNVFYGVLIDHFDCYMIDRVDYRLSAKFMYYHKYAIITLFVGVIVRTIYADFEFLEVDFGRYFCKSVHSKQRCGRIPKKLLTISLSN